MAVPAWEEWIATRPESIQKLAREFPFDTVFSIKGQHYYVLGYTEGDFVIVSKINPMVDFDAASATVEYLHANCARESRP